MALTAELDSHVQAARLGALVPVLVELGVECIEDLEFLLDDDIEAREDVTVIQKRRFLELKANLLDARSSSPSESSTIITEVKTERQKAAEKRAALEHPIPRLPSLPAVAQFSAETDRLSTTTSSAPGPTPRTRAMPLVQVLRELENLDLALQEERICSASLADQLHEVRADCAKIAEEKRANEESHARDIAMLEEMLQHLIDENSLLKAKVSQGTTADNSAMKMNPNLGSLVSDQAMNGTKQIESDIIYFNCGNLDSLAIGKGTYADANDVEKNTARLSTGVPYEPEMEL